MSTASSPHELIRARLAAFADRKAFIDGYAPFIAADGILMRARNLREPGTPVRLDLLVADGTRVFTCTGEVTEHRPMGRGDSLAMFIRFDPLDEEAQALVDEALTLRRRRRRTTASQSAARRSGPQVVASGSFRAAQGPQAESSVVDDIAGTLESSLDDIFGDFGESGPTPEARASALPETHRTTPGVRPLFDADETPHDAPGEPAGPLGSPADPLHGEGGASADETAPMPLHVATTTEPQQAAPAPKLAARIRRLTGAQEALGATEEPAARRTPEATPPPLPAVAREGQAFDGEPTARRNLDGLLGEDTESSAQHSPRAEAAHRSASLADPIDAQNPNAERVENMSKQDEAGGSVTAGSMAPEEAAGEREVGGKEEESGDASEKKEQPGFWARLFGKKG